MIRVSTPDNIYLYRTSAGHIAVVTFVSLDEEYPLQGYILQPSSIENTVVELMFCDWKLNGLADETQYDIIPKDCVKTKYVNSRTLLEKLDIIKHSMETQEEYDLED